jgi:hypothetical protein
LVSIQPKFLSEKEVSELDQMLVSVANLRVSQVFKKQGDYLGSCLVLVEIPDFLGAWHD